MTRKRIITFCVTMLLAAAAHDVYQFVEVARDAARRTQCKSHIFQVGFALHRYLEANGEFPRDIVDENGQPLLSWRVTILPYFNGQQLYDEFHVDEPWNSRHNIALLPRMLPYFQCPLCSTEQKNSFCTNYFYVKRKPVYDRDQSREPILFECARANVPWTKPGGLSMADENFVVDSPGQSVSSNHRGGGAYIVRMDGACRYVMTGEDARVVVP